MHSIKIFCLCLWISFFGGFGGSLAVNSAHAQDKPNWELPGGDIILENILPDSSEITIKVNRVLINQDSFSLTGAVFIASATEKTADIDLSIKPLSDAEKANGDNGDNIAKRIKAVVHDINVARLNDAGILPISLPQADDYRLDLTFDAYAEGGIGPIAFSAVSQVLEITGQFAFDEDFNLSDFAADIHRLQAAPFFALGAAFLQSDDVKVAGKLGGHANLREGEKIIDIELQGDDITVQSAKLFPEAQIIKSPHMKAAYDFAKNRMRLDALDIGIRDMVLRAEGEVGGTGKDMVFALKMKLLEGAYSAKDLATDWPLLLSPLPRAWVLENIHAGYADGLDLSLNGSFTEGALAIDDFSAVLNTKDGEFSYWDPMPPIFMQAAVIDFAPAGFSVSSDNLASNGIKNVKASVYITTPGTGDNDADVNIDIRQDFDDLARLLNRPQVELLDKLGLPKTAEGGDFIGKARLKFPLERALQVEDIDFAFDGELTDFYSPETTFGAKIPIHAESFKITGDRDKITVIGDKIGIGELSGKFHWLIDLQDNNSAPDSYKIIVALDEDFWNMSLLQPITGSLGGSLGGLQFGEYINGTAAIEFSVNEKAENTDITVKADLTAAELHIAELNLHKPENLTGLLAINLTQNGDIMKITNFAYDDENNSILLQADINNAAQYALQKLDLKHFKTPTSDLSAVLIYDEQNGAPGFDASITADKVDLIHLFNYTLDTQPSIAEATAAEDAEKQATYGISPNIIKTAATPNFKIALQAGELVGNGNGSAIKDLNFTVEYQNRRLTDMTATMQMQDGTGHINYSTEKTDGQISNHLEGQVPNLGDLLRYAGLSNRMKGGKMHINMASANALHPLKGAFNISDFSLRDAPILAKILQLVSAAEAAKALSGEGIQFKDWQGDVSYKDNVLTFNEGRLRGTSIGLSMHGTFNGNDDRIKLRGTLVPFYWVGANLVKLPILSWIFDDDIDDAIFGFRYGVDGMRDAPDVWVNPISILTPGGLNAIFDGSPNGEKAPKGKID